MQYEEKQPVHLRVDIQNARFHPSAAETNQDSLITAHEQLLWHLPIFQSDFEGNVHITALPVLLILTNCLSQPEMHNDSPFV